MRANLLLGAIIFVIGLFVGGLAIRLADGTAIDWSVTATAVKDAMTAVGVIGAGLWAYFLALRRRTLATQAKLVHSVRLWKLGDRDVLRVSVKVENTGGVQIRPGLSRTYIQTVPLAIDPQQEPEMTWKDLARVEHAMQEDEAYMEPGESETYSFDIEVPLEASYLQLHTVVDCKPGGSSGADTDKDGKRPDNDNWDETALVDLARERKLAADTA